jgi:hypothetical protein
MSSKSVYCLSTSEVQASEIVNQLRLAGFSNNDISALLPDKTGTRDFAFEHHTKAPEGAATGGLIGGLACAALGWLAGAGYLAIPAARPLIAAGPMMAALSGAALGAGVGGILGALAGLGFPEYVARRYRGKIREGNILLSVHCENRKSMREVRKIFGRAGAGAIAASTEAPLGAAAHDTVPLSAPAPAPALR